MQKKLYTVNQIAEMLEMHPKTIRRHIRDGKLLATKLGGQWRVTEADLKQFMEGNQELREAWLQEVGDFIDGENSRADGKYQIVTLIDIFVDSPEEAQAVANALIQVMNHHQPPGQGMKGKFRYLYESELAKARFILTGSPGLIGKMLAVLEKYEGGV